MSEASEWAAAHARHRDFMATELGQLYAAYTDTLIAYWQLDATDPAVAGKLMTSDGAAKLAEKAFKDKLMELAGV